MSDPYIIIAFIYRVAALISARSHELIFMHGFKPYNKGLTIFKKNKKIIFTEDGYSFNC